MSITDEQKQIMRDAIRLTATHGSAQTVSAKERMAMSKSIRGWNNYTTQYPTTDTKDYPPYLDNPKGRKPITTNADRIRAMTDEELADFMICVAQQGGIPLGGVPIRWLDWLKQEVCDGDA